MSDDSLLDRIKASVLRLSESGGRTVQAVDDTAERTRATVSTLSRRRVSQILRQLRAARGLSYEEIQQRTGLSQQLLFDVEYKDRRLTLGELRRLLECYDVGVGDVLGVDVDVDEPPGAPA